MSANSLTTTHNLDFEVAEWITPDFTQFRIGTVSGLWTCSKDSYDILAIDNSQKGNGHLEDVFEWFEFACKRDNKSLRVLEVWNGRFRNHLVAKRGFVWNEGTNVIKTF